MNNLLNNNAMTDRPSRPIRFLREPEVLARVGVSAVTLWRWENVGEFPKRRKIGKHAVAWVEAEVDGWCANRTAVTPIDGEAS